LLVVNVLQESTTVVWTLKLPTKGDAANVALAAQTAATPAAAN